MTGLKNAKKVIFAKTVELQPSCAKPSICGSLNGSIKCVYYDSLKGFGIKRE